MRKAVLISLILPLLLLSTGCQNTKSRAVEGSIIGGIIGAGAGYAIGHQSGHGGEGAGIGAATGAIAGGLIGSQMKKPGQDTSQSAGQAQGYNNPNQMSIDEIVDLSNRGIHEDVIVDRIRMTNTRHTLTPEQVEYLQQQGVGQKVISAMQGAY